jgi:hypothetical protein
MVPPHTEAGHFYAHLRELKGSKSMHDEITILTSKYYLLTKNHQELLESYIIQMNLSLSSYPFLESTIP